MSLNPTTRDIDYLHSHARRPRAEAILQAFAEVLTAHVDAEELYPLANMAGEQVARETPLGPCDTVAGFRDQLALAFQYRDWGWTDVEAEADGVLITLGAVPLTHLFGEGAHWAVGFFEGLLGCWLRDLGAGEALELRHVAHDEDPDNVLRFRLAHSRNFDA
ncbi:MAG: hypothetical protein ABF296_12535 [Oceanococcaceae bacterium]